MITKQHAGKNKTKSLPHSESTQKRPLKFKIGSK